MPSLWAVPIAVDNPDRVHPEHLHAVACKWLEVRSTGPGAPREPASASDRTHWANSKAFSCSPLVEWSSGATGVEIGLLDDGLERRMERSLYGASRRGIRLGEQIAAVDAPEPERCRVEHLAWQDIARVGTAPAAMRFDLLTPTRFRTGRHANLQPSPTLIFGHLRRRWRDLGPPDSEPSIDFAATGLLVKRIDVQTCGYRVRGRELSGLVGTVVVYAPTATEQERQLLDSLGRLAMFAGIGSDTTVGMGVARYTPLAPGDDALPGSSAQAGVDPHRPATRSS